MTALLFLKPSRYPLPEGEGGSSAFSIIHSSIDRAYSSERQPQRKLNLPRRCRRIGDAACGAIPCTRGPGKNRDDHVAEIRVIEQVERFCAELQVRSLGNIELLFHREVEAGQPRPNHSVLGQIPESSRRWQYKN